MTTVRALIAHSRAMLANAYRDYLTTQGYRAAVAADGLECLRIVRTFEPTVLVMDTALRWGGCDGVLAVLRAEASRHCPLVLILASGHDASVLYRLAALGVDYFENAAISAERLDKIIQQVLARARTRSYFPHGPKRPWPWKGALSGQECGS